MSDLGANILVVSDLHFGEELLPGASTERKRAIELGATAFREFLRYHAVRRRDGRPWRLVIAGDLFDFMSVMIPGNKERPRRRATSACTAGPQRQDRRPRAPISRTSGVSRTSRSSRLPVKDRRHRRQSRCRAARPEVTALLASRRCRCRRSRTNFHRRAVVRCVWARVGSKSTLRHDEAARSSSTSRR
jgi:hypothetical protein